MRTIQCAARKPGGCGRFSSPLRKLRNRFLLPFNGRHSLREGAGERSHSSGYSLKSYVGGDFFAATRIFSTWLPASCAPRMNSSQRISELPPFRGLPDKIRTFWPINYTSYFSFEYASSSTASHHWVREFSPGTSTARWENQLSGAAPCQCFTPGAIFTTSPGFRARGSCPHC